MKGSIKGFLLLFIPFIVCVNIYLNYSSYNVIDYGIFMCFLASLYYIAYQNIKYSELQTELEIFKIKEEQEKLNDHVNNYLYDLFEKDINLSLNNHDITTKFPDIDDDYIDEIKDDIVVENEDSENVKVLAV